MSGGMGGGESGVDPPTTTKGDVSGFDTSYARIPIGVDSTVLTADSTEALGLKWAAAAAGYLAPTLGGTVINSGATVSDLTSLSLSSANNIAWNVTTSGVDIDFSEPDIQTISIAATTTFTTSNRAAGKTKTLRIITDGTERTLNFPAGWNFVGTAPTSQAASTTGLLKLINYGTTDAFIVASYQVEGLGIVTPAWKRIVYQQQTGGSANFNVTGLTSTAQYMMFTFAGSFGGNDNLRFRFGTGGSIDTGTSYEWKSGFNGTFAGEASSTMIEVNPSDFESDRKFFLSGTMQWNSAEDGSGTANSRIGTFTTAGERDSTINNYTTSFQYFESGTPITDVRFYANGGNDIRGTLAMYESQ
tara:strand:- start:977 stop:2053 length:1077 start_codon:yes stop_codon:yes gene_type:complete